MNERICRLGLIGKDVSKSTSHCIHEFILQEMGVRCEYEKVSVAPDGFDLVVRRFLGDLDGFNITIPYKRDIMEYLESVEGDAFDFGAVNTVVTATRKGYNTDGAGFLLMLKRAGIAVAGKTVLVLGAGGSGRSCAAALKKAGAKVFLYRRNRVELEEICAQLGVGVATDPEQGGFDILVNCTGVGMHDKEGLSPVTDKAFNGGKVAVDLIYTPKKSEFLRIAENQGLQILNGAGMLFYQAYYADCLYLDKVPDETEAEKLYEKYLEKQA